MSSPEENFSRVAKSVGEAGSIYINQLVYDRIRAGEDVTVLSLGEAFFKIPMFDFKKLDFEKGYHYSDTRGLPDLRKKISEYYESLYGAKSDYEKNIIISAGSKALIFMAMRALCDPDDNILVPEPYWVSYPEQAKLCNAEIKSIPYDVHPKDFSSYFDSKTRMMILNNPNNPAGTTISKEDLETIYQACLERNVTLLVDEAYSDFCLDNSFYSAAKLSSSYRNLIVVNSLSKNMGMSGWRIGYALASESISYQLLKINQHLVTCAPTILQLYLTQYFDDILEHTIPQIKEVVKKREAVSKHLTDIGLKSLGGSCTFYFLIDVENHDSDPTKMAKDLIANHNIAVVPGSFYGESTRRFARIGVGTESEVRIKAALNRIKEYIG